MTTVVARGRGKGIVVRIGEQTEIGRISKAITSTPHVETPIQRKLHTLGKWLVAIAVFLCILVIVIGIAYKRDPLYMVKVGISLAVSVIPEGLVAVTTGIYIGIELG
jgi:P-type Ca2+ transporter type 2C